MEEIGFTYALAFYELADDSGKVREYYEWLVAMVELLQREQQLVKFLESPRFTKTAKRDVLHPVFVKMTMPDLVQSFMDVLLDNDRLLSLEAITNAYDKISKEKEGLVVVDVFSRFPLSDDDKKTLQKELTKRFPGDLHCRYFEDAKLIGGIKVVLDGQIIDNSTFNQLTSLHEILKQS